MSMAHDSHVLQLDSQVELLERLQLLTNFGSNLVTIAGGDGAGKTWLAQRYLEAWALEKNQALLLCFPNQDDEQRRMTILSQLVSEPLFNPADSIAESFARLMEGEGCDVVIAIDDAHLLSESFISELWMLVLESQQNPLWTVNVVLFAQVNTLDALLTRLSYGQEHKPIDLEIDLLSEQEADRFFEQLVVRYVEDDMEKRVRNAYRTVTRRPGEIMALGDHKVEKRIIIRSIIGSPINIALVIVLLLLLVSAGYWWMMSQPSPDDKVQQITQSVEQTAIPTFEQAVPEASEEQASIQVSEEVVDPMLSQAEDDSQSLPPAVTNEVSSVGTEDDQQRVVITSEVVDALLEDKPDSVDTSDIEQVVEDSIPQNESQSEQQNSATEEAAPPVIKFSFTKSELQGFSPRSYTLQLAAVTSLEDVQVFLDTHSLEGNVYIYPTVRNDVEWFIITYENYPTIQVARDAVQTLPSELQNLEPWAKSLNQVQREIERGSQEN